MVCKYSHWNTAVLYLAWHVSVRSVTCCVPFEKDWLVLICFPVEFSCGCIQNEDKVRTRPSQYWSFFGLLSQSVMAGLRGEPLTVRWKEEFGNSTMEELLNAWPIRLIVCCLEILAMCIFNSETPIDHRLQRRHLFFFVFLPHSALNKTLLPFSWLPVHWEAYNEGSCSTDELYCLKFDFNKVMELHNKVICIPVNKRSANRKLKSSVNTVVCTSQG